MTEKLTVVNKSINYKIFEIAISILRNQRRTRQVSVMSRHREEQHLQQQSDDRAQLILGGRYIKKEALTQLSFLDFRINTLPLLKTNRTRACTTHADQNKNMPKEEAKDKVKEIVSII